MDVKTLYTLVAVADHGSFNAAARALGVSLSSVSLQMKGLEDEVDRVLFDRSRRPPPLTADGRDLVERARDLIGDWERLSATLKRSGDSGVLKIGAVHTVVSGLLPAALLALRETMPDLEVRLTTGLTHELETALVAGRIDVAVTTEPETVPAGMDFSAFCEEPLVVIASAGAAGATVREVLTENPYVRFARQARVAVLIDHALDRLGIRIRSAMEIDTLEGVISLVGAGLGVSIVPARSGARFPDSIRVLPFGDPPVSRTLGLLAPKKGARTRFVSPLLAALRGRTSGIPAGTS